MTAHHIINKLRGGGYSTRNYYSPLLRAFLDLFKSKKFNQKFIHFSYKKQFANLFADCFFYFMSKRAKSMAFFPFSFCLKEVLLIG